MCSKIICVPGLLCNSSEIEEEIDILLNLENCENVTLCIYPVTLCIYHEADCMFLLFYFLNTSTFTFLIVI